MLTAVETRRLSRTTARKELARRELARRHVLDFAQYISPWYQPARHLRLVEDKLEQLEKYIETKGREGIGRLLVCMPPRHGKSELISRNFPAWLLGKLPDKRIIITSYGADLAVSHSRSARDIVMSDKYRALFGDLASVEQSVMISDDSRSVQAWDLAAPHRGGMVAAGVGGAITGKGADLLIVDDPFKNREEAESPSARDRVWEWWISTAYTRLEDGAAVVGMLTRWHVDDWMGRLLRKMTEPGMDQYEVVWLPALWEGNSEKSPQIKEDKSGLETDQNKNERRFTQKKEEKSGLGIKKIATAEEERLLRRSAPRNDMSSRESAGSNRNDKLLEGIWEEEVDLLGRKDGEALWPEKYDAEDLQRIRDNVGLYEWLAQYQQMPYSREGNMFRREWFAVVETAPEKIRRRVRYWDKAGTEGGGAYTAGVCMSMGEDGLIYVEHVARGQWETFAREEETVKTGLMDKQFRPGHTVIWHFQDPGSAGVDSAKATNGKLALAGLESHFEVVTGSKEVRAGPWSSALEAGLVRVVKGGWNEKYIEEHVSFPKGRYKDQVDGSSGAFSKLKSGVLDGQIFF